MNKYGNNQNLYAIHKVKLCTIFNSSLILNSKTFKIYKQWGISENAIVRKKERLCLVRRDTGGKRSRVPLTLACT